MTAASRETAGVAVVIPELCLDLDRETAVLMRCLQSLELEDWALDTPADGWTVLDQIGHLAYFDEMETLAVTDPERFCAARDVSRSEETSVIDAAVVAGRAMSPAATLDRFSASRAAMSRAFLDADPAARVPWYGPSMSVGAAVTARIMETWAHGQDVFDGLDRPHPVTTALRQVAHIGVRALPNSFRTRQLDVPTEPVYVRLEAPAGDLWEWGPIDSADRVSGSALDFCLVATQRRHVADTELEITGAVAEEWMDIAQAFAGAAGTGRLPGQFPR